MATKTHERAELSALRHLIDDFRVDVDSTGELVVRTLDQFLIAASYRDPTLIQSALEDALAAMGRLFHEEVERRVGRSAAGLKSTQQFVHSFEGRPVDVDEEFDELGRLIGQGVSQALNYLRGFRDGPLAGVRKHGVVVANAAKLDEQIALWEQVKANLVDCWPWTDAPLPPADRGMIAASRAALQRGERGESLEAVIERRRSK